MDSPWLKCKTCFGKSLQKFTLDASCSQTHPSDSSTSTSPPAHPSSAPSGTSPSSSTNSSTPFASSKTTPSSKPEIPSSTFCSSSSTSSSSSSVSHCASDASTSRPPIASPPIHAGGLISRLPFRPKEGEYCYYKESTNRKIVRILKVHKRTVPQRHECVVTHAFYTHYDVVAQTKFGEPVKESNVFKSVKSADLSRIPDSKYTHGFPKRSAAFAIPRMQTRGDCVAKQTKISNYKLCKMLEVVPEELESQAPGDKDLTHKISFDEGKNIGWVAGNIFKKFTDVFKYPPVEELRRVYKGKIVLFVDFHDKLDDEEFQYATNAAPAIIHLRKLIEHFAPEAQFLEVNCVAKLKAVKHADLILVACYTSNTSRRNVTLPIWSELQELSSRSNNAPLYPSLETAKSSAGKRDIYEALGHYMIPTAYMEKDTWDKYSSKQRERWLARTRKRFKKAGYKTSDLFSKPTVSTASNGAVKIPPTTTAISGRFRMFPHEPELIIQPDISKYFKKNLECRIHFRLNEQGRYVFDYGKRTEKGKKDDNGHVFFYHECHPEETKFAEALEFSVKVLRTFMKKSLWGKWCYPPILRIDSVFVDNLDKFVLNEIEFEYVLMERNSGLDENYIKEEIYSLMASSWFTWCSNYLNGKHPKIRKPSTQKKDCHAQNSWLPDEMRDWKEEQLQEYGYDLLYQSDYDEDKAGEYDRIIKERCAEEERVTNLKRKRKEEKEAEESKRSREAYAFAAKKYGTSSMRTREKRKRKTKAENKNESKSVKRE